jgi:hypothetical protein
MMNGGTYRFAFWRNYLQQWDVVCSNSRVGAVGNHYYDALAYRSAHWDKNWLDHWHVIHDPLDPPEVVESCFGGIGIYRREAVGGCMYEGGDCEHISFHKCIRKAGGIVLFNPRQTVEYNNRN